MYIYVRYTCKKQSVNHPTNKTRHRGHCNLAPKSCPELSCNWKKQHNAEPCKFWKLAMFSPLKLYSQAIFGQKNGKTTESRAPKKNKWKSCTLIITRHSKLPRTALAIEYDTFVIGDVWNIICIYIYVYICQYINTLQHIATHCNTLQHTATHCNTLQHTRTQGGIEWVEKAKDHCKLLQHAATRSNTQHHTATRCNTLQHRATQHTATHCNAHIPRELSREHMRWKTSAKIYNALHTATN